MNSGENYPAKLEDGWLVGHPTGHGFDLALLQDMRRRVARASSTTSMPSLSCVTVYSFTSSTRPGRIRTA